MNILIIQGHPDAAGGHLCHALADAYAEGAEAAGHNIRRQEVAQQPVTFIHNAAEYARTDLPEFADHAQKDLLWCEHVVLIFPLWLGGMPAMLKAWMEHVFREGFAFTFAPKFTRNLKGRSARIVVPMGAPAALYRIVFGGFGLRMLRRSVLGMAGIGPVRRSLIGLVDELDTADLQGWLDTMRNLGAKGE